MLKIAIALITIASLAGCGTTAVGLKYQAPAGLSRAAASAPATLVGSFDDKRGEPATWLGAIRGGFGNPLKNLESDRPVAEVVQAAFADGLKARGVPVVASAGARQLRGVIKKLECNQLLSRESTVEIELSVLDASGRVLATRSFKSTKSEVSLMSSGVFASVDDLRTQLELTLRATVDQAFNDRQLRAAMQI